MEITRISNWSGIERTREIPVTQEQLDAYNNGQLIQRAMPNLSESDREFIISGMIDEEWQEMASLWDGDDSESE